MNSEFREGNKQNENSIKRVRKQFEESIECYLINVGPSISFEGNFSSLQLTTQQLGCLSECIGKT